ncbi:diguanylate cyclase [Bacillota bacterium LX-D]|nr:diguanylate cyclase [Bacillota bacterium LX-D]
MDENVFYRVAVDNSSTAYAYYKIIYSADGSAVDYEYIAVNPAFEKLMNLKAADIIGKKSSQVVPGVKRKNHCWMFYLNKLAKGGRNTLNIYFENVRRWCKVYAYSPAQDYFVAEFHDITAELAEDENKLEKIKIEEALQNEQAQLLSLLESIDEPIFVSDLESYEILFANQNVKDIFGSDIVGKKCFQVMEKRDRPCKSCADQVGKWQTYQTFRFEKFNQIAQKHYQITDRIIKWPDGRNVRLEIAVDITEIIKREKEITYLSYHDKLTGLYNRAFLEKELHRLDTEKKLPISLIMGDVNGLKLVNDVFGHQQGDKLLKLIAKILCASCRSQDIIGRWGGDEFVMLLPETPEPIANEICERIKRHCNQYNCAEFSPSISLGYATKDKHNEDINSILTKAEDYMYKHKLLESRSHHNYILASMKKTLYERSCQIEEHADRIVEICKKVGSMMKLSGDQLNDLEVFAMLHDIGKIAIKDSILNKPGKLTEEEWLEMRKHPEIGYRIAQTVPELMPIAKYILAHHERWDGKGYPQGLKGKEIPLLARILAIADAYDAMTEDRPYRKAMSSVEAREELVRNAGTQFDPEILQYFLSILP